MALHRSLWESRLNSEELSLLVHDQDPVFISVHFDIFSFVLIKTLILRMGGGKVEEGRGDMFSSKDSHSGITCNTHVAFLVSVTDLLSETS